MSIYMTEQLYIYFFNFLWLLDIKIMVRKVRFESDALQVCMAHALSTEKEEVMGLLIGEVSQLKIPQ